ncbi:ABC transporter ATP-binding protein [Mycoplasma sp. Pen4]|uniref:ABC transporter ATP-binding protein n=1 Tax=Mycoplasma sp. Pen4 TaxID=640330 RepID=UPI001654493B|nr:ABC transporter ATP-binding protein [Mycoplasma sp. Pen4]QNM93541.1 ABC transporter ATP-binding protein [Mycoplasma sp. Pen4]
MLTMFKILPRKIKWLFASGIFLVLLNVAFTMLLPIALSQFLPLLFKDATDPKFTIEIFKREVYSSTDQQTVFHVLIVATIILIVLATLTSVISTMIIVWAGERASNFYRDRLFAKYQKLSLKDISQLTPESMITRINDDVAVFWDFLVGASTALIKAPLFFIVGLIFAFSTDINLTWSIIAVIPFLLFVVGYIFIKVNPLLSKNRKNLDRITKEVQETIGGTRFIKANNLQESQFQKFDNANKTWLKTEKNIFKYFALGTPTFFVIINLVIIFIYAMAQHQLNGLFDAGATHDQKTQMMSNINLFIEFEVLIALGIIMFSQFLGNYFRARVSSKRIVEVFDYKYDELQVEDGLSFIDSDESIHYGVEFKNVNFKYFEHADEYALKDINFKIDGGKTLGIIGPTGSGKSTIANLIVNNMKYTEGNILINNKEVKDVNSVELHKRVAIVYQEALLYSGTIKSNMLFAKPDATDEEIKEALDASCSYNFIIQFPERENRVVAQRGKNLSGGQKQRLSIARSLLLKPKVLVLDDSTSALDNLTTNRLIKNIKQNYDCTTIIISQKINSIKHADKILVMNNGEILAQGTHDELIKNCQWYHDINANQLEQ